MKKIVKSLWLIGILVSLQNVYGQIGQITRKDFDLKGPVRLYKEMVYKDFHQKFDHYEPAVKQIAHWYLSDKEGQILFNQVPKDNGLYIRYLHHYKNNRIDIGLTTSIKSDGVSLLDSEGYDSYWIYKYPDRHTLKVYDYSDKELMKIKKYNPQGLLVETFYRPENEEYGYRDLWKYDKNGKETEKKHYNGLGKLMEKEVWKRDPAGRVLAYFSYDSTGNLAQKFVYAYNKAGKAIRYVLYNASGVVVWGDTSIYRYDTLLETYYSYEINKNFPYTVYHDKYDSAGHLIRRDYDVIKKRPQKGNYTLFKYNANGNLTIRLYYNHGKLYEKSVRSDFVGPVYQKSVRESYDENGGLQLLQVWKEDKYGNQLFYEKDTVVNKFGEQQKIPLEKQEAKITYFDKDTPDVAVTFEKRHHKKQDYLDVTVKNLSHCSTIFYIQPSVGGSHEPDKKWCEDGRVSYLYMLVKSFTMPWFIVTSGDENYLFPVPNEAQIAKKPAKINVNKVKTLFHKK